eukprot:NODE_968_length_1199_cov_292.311304_g733_i0.p1 GENE.NODE_968_length_1199_cov_292.311304_g733_i0~~NODE_968_length_1199_cov_292.311304_g733_i0.p1  ORF type:complete len:278 (-),score=42.58 NODE_968_length_1199_cov_292.311304_g733_i0:322-1155(-)
MITRLACVLPRAASHLKSNVRYASVLSLQSWKGASGHLRHASPRFAPMTIGGIRSMFIQTADTPNPHSLKFIPGRIVLEEEFGSGMDIVRGSDEFRNSPLAKALLKIEGTTRIFLGRDFYTVTKEESIKWEYLKPIIFADTMDFFATGARVVTESKPSDTTILDDDDEVVAMIKELLETRIRPAVQEDGGDIFYRSFNPETGVVEVQMAGSCAGCPSSEMTLRNGVENMLMHYIPEVERIELWEDEELKTTSQLEFDEFEKRLKAAGVPSDELGTKK